MRGSDFYGIQNIFCSYAQKTYRGYFPYAVQHGWQIAATAYESVDHPAEIWVWSERIRQEISKFYEIDRIRVVGSPYLYLPQIAPSKNSKNVGIYILPHSSHFAKIGFSHSDLADLLVLLRKEHHELHVLIYYLDVEPRICELMRRLGIRLILCGGLWSRNFMENFRDIITTCEKVYYSEFGSAILFSQYEGKKCQFVSLSSQVISSTNVHVNELSSIMPNAQAETELDFRIELGIDHKLTKSECRELLGNGYKTAPIGRAAKKILANFKNPLIDNCKNLKPALKLVEYYNSSTPTQII